MELKAEGLCATWPGPVYAVHGVDFEARDGESVGIAGESACGKTTLGLAVMRMLQGGSVSGTITLGNKEILGMPEQEFDSALRWKEVAMVFQGAMSSLDPVFTVKDQLYEVMRRHGRNAGDADALDAVRSVGLDPGVLSKYPHELSGGMKQRVVIAMALLLRPGLVIADEPTTALDVLVQAQIISLLKSLKGKGMSFVLITHDMAVLSELCDVVGIMYGGQMVEFGALKDVYQNPKHPYTQGLLESVPTLGGKRPGFIPGSPPSLADAPGPCRFMDRCPHAAKKCLEPPPKVRTGRGYVRCWLYDESASVFFDDGKARVDDAQHL